MRTSTIAIDARSINSTTGRYVQSLLRNLEGIDERNRYVILVLKKDLNYYQPTNDRFSIIEADYRNYSVREQTSFLRLLHGLPIDLVHFCMPQQPVLYRGKSVTTIHDLTLLKTYNRHHRRAVFEFKRAVGRYVFHRIGRTSDAVITPSNFTRQEYLEFSGVVGDKVHTIYEGADRVMRHIEPFPGLVDRDFLLYVGTQAEYKNVRRLIYAHQELLGVKGDLILALVGRLDGRGGASLRPNQAWVREMGFRNIIFTGYVPDGQLAWLYLNARAYVFPSLMEGFGLPGLEAMTYGTPLVSSNLTCLPEIYGDGATYFDPYSVQSITEAVSRVIHDGPFVEELRRRGHAVAARYSWRRMAEQTLAIYEAALNDGSETPV